MLLLLVELTELLIVLVLMMLVKLLLRGIIERALERRQTCGGRRDSEGADSTVLQCVTHVR